MLELIKLINIYSGFVSFCFNVSKFSVKNVAGQTEESPLLKHGDLMARNWQKN